MMHDSDCATNNAPALPVGPCDCTVVSLTERRIERESNRLIWQCNCGNSERFKLYADGDVKCDDCGSVADAIRTFNPLAGPGAA